LTFGKRHTLICGKCKFQADFAVLTFRCMSGPSKWYIFHNDSDIYSYFIAIYSCLKE